jgi:hypothetical protein
MAGTTSKVCHPSSVSSNSSVSHKSAAGHRVVVHFEYPSIRPGSLERVLIYSDITERKAAEEEIRRARDTAAGKLTATRSDVRLNRAHHKARKIRAHQDV